MALVGVPDVSRFIRRENLQSLINPHLYITGPASGVMFAAAIAEDRLEDFLQTRQHEQDWRWSMPAPQPSGTRQLVTTTG